MSAADDDADASADDDDADASADDEADASAPLGDGDKASHAEKASTGESSPEDEYRAEGPTSADPVVSDAEESATSAPSPLPVRDVPVRWQHAILDCAPGSLNVYYAGYTVLTFANRPQPYQLDVSS